MHTPRAPTACTHHAGGEEPEWSADWGEVQLVLAGHFLPQDSAAKTVTYTSTNKDGATTTLTRKVTLVDATPPVITILGGAEPLQVEANRAKDYNGDSAVDPGATAYDVVDKEVVTTVVGQSVDLAKLGPQQLKYVKAVMRCCCHRLCCNHAAIMLPPPLV